MEHQRRTGVTTRLALEHALHALNNPGQWVICHDHFEGVPADYMLCNIVADIFRALGVAHQLQGYSILVIPIQHKEYAP